MPDFIGSLLSCERQLQSKLQWRLQESFISKISFVEGLVSPEQLYLKFVPVTFKYILGNVSDIMCFMYVCAMKYMCASVKNVCTYVL